MIDAYQFDSCTQLELFFEFKQNLYQIISKFILLKTKKSELALLNDFNRLDLMAEFFKFKIKP
jgi:hypothetical protein